MAIPLLLPFEIKKEKSKDELIVRDHPSKVIEIPQAFNNVDLPEACYILDLPSETINSGALSAIQLEAIIYSCQRHEQTLSDGSRAGFLIGDGAGVGKGRIAAGVIFENFIRGRKKSIWFSISTDLKYDAERDFRDIGCGDKIAVHAVNKLKNAKTRTDVTESTKEGVIFCTYSDLINELSSSTKRLLCLEQLLKWCGPNFDGVIVFDECHLTNDITFSGSANKRKIELAVLQLQNKLPNARIVYISTTAISEPHSMASMVRLGLWGQDTPFKDFGQFIGNVNNSGEIAGDMIAMEMRQRGSYVNRQLSFKDVTYQVVEVCQLPKFITTYDGSVKLWVQLQQSFTETVELLDLGPIGQKIVWAHFWSAHQKFFKCLCMSAKITHAVKLASEAVKCGESVVIGFQSTGEAYTVQKIPDDGSAMLNYVSTAKMIMQTLVEKHFPDSDSLHLLAEASNNKGGTVGGKRKSASHPVETPKRIKQEITDDPSYCEVIESSDTSAPVFDYHSDSEADLNLKDEETCEDRKIKLEKASKIRQRLLEKIEELGSVLPPNWIDQLIDEFGGSENVAEISSRKGRLVQKNNGLVQYEPRSEKDVPLELINIRERERFMNGEKKIAIVSAAASCGISLHADRRAKNQSRRIYISLELPNSAELALQQFGCTHRSNQAKAPEFIFLVPQLAGERRSALIIANRLKVLGATYTNQRIDKYSTEFYLEEVSEYDCAVRDAMNVITDQKSLVLQVPPDYKDYFFGDIKAALTELGLVSSNILPLINDGIPEILNRILGIPVDLQANLLEYCNFVRSMISNQEKMDGSNDVKILDLGFNKCVHHRKVLKLTSQTSKNPISPANIYLHEIEVDGGMDWRTAEEKWLPKSGQADEGIYFSKGVFFEKRDIIIVRRIKNVGDGDKGDLKYTVIRPCTGVQLLPQSLTEITRTWIPQLNAPKLAKIEPKWLWDFHYNASKDSCIHYYWMRKDTKKHRKNKGPEGCQEGLRSCATYKLLAGSIFLLWKEIESILKENNPQWKMQIARVFVGNSNIVGILIPDNCESQLIPFLTKYYPKVNCIMH